MREIGSDFHYIDSFSTSSSGFLLDEANYYANGRQALIALITSHQWQRIWMPDYFCYQIIESIKKTGITILFYPDTPISSDIEEIAHIEFEEGDVLFRMNYFGIRGFRCNRHINIPVIEDHSHDLMGYWATKSNADWCIASLRKTLPIPEGGILWSPLGHPLPKEPIHTDANNKLAQLRWQAMILKRDYLDNLSVDKTKFLDIFSRTESGFESINPSQLDEKSINYLRDFNILDWYRIKDENWKYLTSLLELEQIRILKAELSSCFNFSFTILFNNEITRNRVRGSLISNSIYPAILWDIPKDRFEDSKNFSTRMLSIPCDARYTKDDIQYISTILQQALLID